MEEFELKISEHLDKVAESLTSDAQVTDAFNRAASHIHPNLKTRFIILVALLATLIAGSTGGFLVAHSQSLASNNYRRPLVQSSSPNNKGIYTPPNLKQGNAVSPPACVPSCGTSSNGQMIPYCPLKSGTYSSGSTGNSGNSGNSGSTQIPKTTLPPISTTTTTSIVPNTIVSPVCDSCLTCAESYITVFRRTTVSGVTIRLYKDTYSTCSLCYGTGASGSGTCNACKIVNGGTVQQVPNSGNTGGVQTTIAPSPMPITTNGSTYVLELSTAEAVSSQYFSTGCSGSAATASNSTICYYDAPTFGYQEGRLTAYIIVAINPNNNLGITSISGSLSQIQNTQDSMELVDNIAVLAVPLPQPNSYSSFLNSLPVWNLNFYNSAKAMVYSTSVNVGSSIFDCPSTSTGTTVACG